MPGKRAKDNDEDSVISERFQPLKTVASLMGEGEKFCRDQLFTKAIECYSEVNKFNRSCSFYVIAI